MLKRNCPPPALEAAISYTINDAATVVGIGRTKIYELANEGKLRLVKVGGRTLIPAADLRALVEGGADPARVAA